MARTIIHLDADAFFASVEQATDARLRGKPIAVGGEKRGIVASASYEARKFGVYTPMPTVMARRLCPKLIMLPGDFEKYEFFSRLMFSYAYDFTPDVEIGSIDEGYADLTGARKSALEIAQTIRQAIRQSLKLSVSEGVGANKLISQIASKLQKPAAFQVVPPGYEAQFLSPLPNKWLPGIGPKAANQLNAAGLARIGQIAQTPADLLGLLVGSVAPQLRNFARGIDERPIIPVRAPAKSYSHQETFAADTTDEPFLDATLRRMADKLMATVREDHKSIRTLTVKVRYNDMDEDQASESLQEPTDLECDVYANVSRLLRKAWTRRVSLRMVSLKFSNVYNGPFCSGLALDISSCQREAQQRLAGVVDDLRRRFGRSVLLRAHDFVLRIGTGSLTPRFSDARAAAQCGGAGNPGKPVRPLHRSPAVHPSNYHRAIVQRQRLGHYASRQPPHGKARRIISPGPELQFRAKEQRRRSPSPRSPTAASFIPLNVHSYFSFLDSTLSTKAIVELAQRHELPAIALTDRNNLHGAVEFAQAASAAGIKPIISAEIDWGGQRVCLYVENQKGYHNLCKILNQIHGVAGAAHRAPLMPHCSPPSRRDFSDQIRVSTRRTSRQNVPLSSSLSRGSFCSAKADRGEGWGEEAAFSLAEMLASTEGLIAVSPAAELAQFFPNRFYLEISDPQSITHASPALPCVASLPIHYDLPRDRWKYDVVQSVRTLTLLRQQHPQKRLDRDYHFRSAVEMQKQFGSRPELLRHTVEIAERCSFQFTVGKPQFPGYAPADGSTPAAFLRRLVMDGLRRRYPQKHAQLKPQLEEELAIITEVGYEEYFLIVWDFLRECRHRGIEWITRGSAADSLACYCLEISGVCPIRFDLYFRRFLNKERMALNKLPDIDVDFPHDRKDDVIDLIFEKYGSERCAIVGGFSTFQSRSAFAEVAKVLGVSDFQVRRLTERLPQFARAGELAEAVAESQECRDLPFEEEPYRAALHMAHFLDGFPRYPKMHPCGLVLSRQPMNQIVPCFISAKGYPTTHFDMDSIEAVGLIKMDILAQGGLAVMRDVEESLKFKIQNSKSDVATSSTESQRSVLNLAALEPWTDPEVWQLIASGHARAVHHIESPAMISLCKMCNVQDIDTLVAIVSVIRPGAANESKKMEFARRYQGLSTVQYAHPSLEPCLRSTFGLVVYEEHILQICEAFAGLPPGRADVLRRALGKDRQDIIDEIETEFAECARKLGRAENQIAEVWQLVVGFKGYAFCKAHSTAYGVEAYQSAWLKLHYPAEFMAAVLTNGKGFYDPLVYILECHRLGIPLLAPSVNQPGPQFTVTQTASIRVPALNIKGLTLRTRETILRERSRREFVSLRDFMTRVQPLNEEMQSLIQAGAFDIFGKPRTTQYWEFRALASTNAASTRTNKPWRDELPRVLNNEPWRDELPRVLNLNNRNNEPRNNELRRDEIPRVLNNEPRNDEPWRDEIPRVRNGTPSGTPYTETLQHPRSSIAPPRQLCLIPPEHLELERRLPSVPLDQPERLQYLRWEEQLFGYPVTGHPLELYPDIAWDTYCPIDRLGEHVGEQIVTCGLVIEQRLFHQSTGEPMKFITIADWTGIVETELFARTYKSYGLNTVRYRVLEITATVEPFENGRGFTLRVLRAGKPRTKERP